MSNKTPMAIDPEAPSLVNEAHDIANALPGTAALNDITAAKNRGQAATAVITSVVDTLTAAGHTATDADNLPAVIEAVLQRIGAYHTALEANAAERQKMSAEIRDLQQTVLSMAIELHGPPAPVGPMTTASRPERSPRKTRA